jgi:ATP-binding cassette subfamily B protein
MRTLQYRQVYDFIKEILTPFKNYLLVFIALVTFESFEFVIQPYLMKLVVDGLHQSSSKLSLGVLTTVPIIPLGLYLGFSWLTLLITRIYEWLEIEFYPTLKTRVIRKLVQHIMHHSHGFYQNQLPGSLTSKINEVSTSIQKLVVTCIERFYGYSSRLLLTIIILSQVQVIFAIMMSCWAVFFFLFSWHWSKKAKDYAEKSAEAMNSVWGSIVDLFSNAALMRFFTAWDFERKYLKRLTEHSKKSQKFFAYYLFKKRLIYGVSYRMLETLSIIVLVSAYKKSLITVGDFVLMGTIKRAAPLCRTMGEGFSRS